MRVLWKNIGLWILSTFLLLFLLEMSLRVTELVPAHTLEYASPDLWKSNPGPLRPGQMFVDRFKPGLAYHVAVNDLGFRGPAAPLHKIPGTLRVLCLGDSYTFGSYVDDQSTWPAQLETILRGKELDFDLEVINAGISGFTIVDELAFLDEHGLQLDPDVAVLAFTLNDLVGLSRRAPARETLRRASERSSGSAIGRLKARMRQTASYNLLFLAKSWLLKGTGVDPTLQEPDTQDLLRTDDDAARELFDRYRQHLAEMKRLLDGRGIPIVLLLFPSWEQTAQAATDQPQARITAMARELQIPTVDLLPSFRKIDPRGRKFFNMPKDHHPTARGYRRAAIYLAAELEPILAERGHPSAPNQASAPGGQP